MQPLLLCRANDEVDLLPRVAIRLSLHSSELPGEGEHVLPLEDDPGRAPLPPQGKALQEVLGPGRATFEVDVHVEPLDAHIALVRVQLLDGPKTTAEPVTAEGHRSWASAEGRSESSALAREGVRWVDGGRDHNNNHKIAQRQRNRASSPHGIIVRDARVMPHLGCSRPPFVAID